MIQNPSTKRPSNLPLAVASYGDHPTTVELMKNIEAKAYQWAREVDLLLEYQNEQQYFGAELVLELNAEMRKDNR